CTRGVVVSATRAAGQLFDYW
nr:immunoglobulin heavy chain junction region [Macaca mulatta]